MSSNSNEINNQFASLFRWVPVALLLSVLAIGFAPLAIADSFTYSYVGNAYNQFGGTFVCPPVCGITGSFTVAAPLTPNANYYFTPLSFSFTDGLTVFAPSSVTKSDFGVVTNSLGQIVGWNMDWQIPTDEMFSGTNPPGCVGCRVVDGSFDPNIAFAEISDSPGTWTMSTSAPEPSSLLLLTMGLMATVGSSLKMKKSRLS
jgi:hypothetical protein